MNNKTLTNILKGLAGIIIYFSVSIFKSVPLYALGINPAKLPLTVQNIYSIFMELLIIISIYMMFRKDIHRCIKEIKKNNLKYFTKYLKVYILALIVMMVSNVIINTLGGGASENEAIIRETFKQIPIFTFISAVFLAPVLEELVFRKCFRAIFQNNFLFITISSLVFGGLHLIGMPFDELFPLYLISYCSCGVAFAYMYVKTNNIFVSMGFHFMHNGILMAMQTFLLMFT